MALSSASRYPKREEGAVAVTAQRGEQLIEMVVRNALGNPMLRAGPVAAHSVGSSRVAWVAVNLGPAGSARAIQWKWINQRSLADLDVEIVEGAQHRFSVYSCRRGIPRGSAPLSCDRVDLFGSPPNRRSDARSAAGAPVRSNWLVGQQHPASEVPALRRCGLVLSDVDGPQKPPPPQQIMTIGP